MHPKDPCHALCWEPLIKSPTQSPRVAGCKNCATVPLCCLSLTCLPPSAMSGFNVTSVTHSRSTSTHFPRWSCWSVEPLCWHSPAGNQQNGQRQGDNQAADVVWIWGSLSLYAFSPQIVWPAFQAPLGLGFTFLISGACDAVLLLVNWYQRASVFPSTEINLP